MRLLPVLVVFGLASGCGVFGSADSPSDPTADGGSGGDAGTDGPPPVGEQPGLRFTLAPVPSTIEVIRGATTKVPLTITREIGFNDPVVITTKDIRDSILSAPLSITADHGDLELQVPAGAPQGPATGTIVATAGGITVTTPVSLFVRGKPGDLDTRFANQGYLTGLLGTLPLRQKVIDAKLAADDSVYIVTRILQTGATNVVHIKSDGKPDTAYGTNGVAFLGLGLPYAAALQPDGKLVIVGGGEDSTVVGRLDTTGQPDATFGAASGGSGGALVVGTGGLDGHTGGAYGVAVRGDGDIFVAWDNLDTTRTIVKTGMARLAPNGTFRTAFGASGTGRFALGLTTAMVIRDNPGAASNGNLVMAWAGDTYAPNIFGHYEMTSDTGAGAGGVKTLTIPGARRDIGNAGVGLVILPDQSAVTGVMGTSGLYLRKFDTSGNGVAAFGAAGLAGPFTIASGSALGIAVQADGKILVATSKPGGQDAMRFTATGTIDTDFGFAGHTMSTLGTATKVIVQKSGRILVVGPDANDDLMVGAYWP